MMAAGMTLARIKMADCTEEECHEMICNIRKANDAYSKSIGRVFPCPIALHLKGPDIRTGSLKDVIYVKQIVFFSKKNIFIRLKRSFLN